MGRYLKDIYTEHPELPLVGIWKIEETEDELLALLDNAADYATELSGLHARRRREEWLATRVLLQEMLSSPCHICYHENGAPYLKGSPLHISISHTKGYAAVLIQSTPAAGIDLEYRSERVHTIKSRFISSEEGKNIDPAHETASLLLHWCAKETLFKMINCTNIDFREHLHVLPHRLSSSGEITVKETKTAESRSFRLAYRLEKEFMLVWSTGISWQE